VSNERGNSIRKKHVTVKIPIDLIEEVDKLIGKHGFRSRGEIAKEAIRRIIKDYEHTILMPLPRLELVTVDEKGACMHAKILDRTLQRVVDVNINPKPWCSFCQAGKCEHIDFALSRREKAKEAKQVK